MTDLARLVVRMEAENAKLHSQLDKSTKKLQSFERRAAKVGRNIRKQLSGVLLPFATLAGSAALFRGVVGQLADFEKTLSGVRAVTGATDDQMAALESTARELGASTQFSASEAADGMRFLGQAGFRANQIIEALPATLDLAAAGALELGEAADIASNVLSGFGEAADQTGRVADVFAKAAASSNTDVRQLGEAMSYVAPIASALDQSIEETTAAVGALGNAGIQASSAGTGLREALISLANPTTKAADALERVGLTVDQVNPKQHKLSELVKLFADRSLQAADAIDIFGTRGGSAFLALTSQNDQMQELVDRLDDAEGAARRMADTMSDNLSGDLKELDSAVSELTQKLGESGLTSALRSAVQAGTDFSRWVGSLVDGGTLQQLQERIDKLQAAGVTPGAPGSGILERLKGLRSEKLAELDGLDGLTEKLTISDDKIRNQEKRIGELVAAMAAIPEAQRGSKKDIRLGGQGITLSRKSEYDKLSEELQVALQDLKSAHDDRTQQLQQLEELSLGTDDEPPIGSGPPGGTPLGGAPAGDSSSGNRSTRQLDRYRDALQRLRDELDPTGAKVREFEEDMALLQRALRGGDISFEEYERLEASLTTNGDAAKRAAEHQQELARALRGVADQVDPTARLVRELNDLDALLSDPGTPAEYFGIIQERMLQLHEEIDKVNGGLEEQVEKTSDVARDLGLTFSSAFEDAIVGGEKLGDVLSGLEKDLLRVATRKLITEPLTESFSSAFSKGGGGSSFFSGVGSFFGSLFANDRGGIYKVSGSPLVEQPIALKAKGDETITVTPNGGTAAGMQFYMPVTIQANNPNEFRGSDQQIANQLSIAMRSATRNL